MAELPKFSLALPMAFSLVGFSVSEHSPETSLSPSPEIGTDSPPPLAPTPKASSPANSRSTSSPPAPPPSDISPGSSSTPSHSTPKSTPPAPSAPEGAGSSEGMRGAKMGGIAIGVILAAGLVVVGGLVYKKRRDNIRRSQYGYAWRGEM